MTLLEEEMKNVVLTDVEFVLSNKVIKKGKIHIFNTKQFFIKFKIEKDEELKEFELPYPYSLKKTNNGYLFDYCLSSFMPPTEEVYWKMKMVDTTNSSKYHNNYLYLNILYP